MKWTLLFAALVLAAPAGVSQGRCAEHIETYSAEEIAAEMGRSVSWVLQNYRTNLWQRPTPEGKGRKVGELLPGSRAVILDEREEDYRVRSPYDESVGWVNKVQVKKTLYQDTETRRPCTPGRELEEA